MRKADRSLHNDKKKTIKNARNATTELESKIFDH